MLEMTAAAATLLRLHSGKGAPPLLTAITLPRAFRLTPHQDGTSAPRQTVRLRVDQLSGVSNLVALAGSELPAQHGASPGDSIHLAATASRMRQGRPARPAAILQAAEQMLSQVVDKQLMRTVVVAQPSASWAVISAASCEPDVAASLDCALHLGAVLQPRSAARSLRVPASAASHLCSHAHPEVASTHAAAGERGPLDAVQTVSDHWLVSQGAHGGSSTQGLVSKPMSSSANGVPGASRDLSDTADADASSQMVHEVIHCVNAPVTAEGRTPAQAASFALPRRPQHRQLKHDGLLRGMAASLATAQQAHTSASQLQLRTAGALSHDGSVGPHGPASAVQAARGTAAWSLARCLEAEAAGQLGCSGSDTASATARSATSVEMLLGSQPRSGLVGCGMDMRTSVSAGEMMCCCCCCCSLLSNSASRQDKVLLHGNQDQLRGWKWATQAGILCAGDAPQRASSHRMPCTAQVASSWRLCCHRQLMRTCLPTAWSRSRAARWPTLSCSCCPRLL